MGVYDIRSKEEWQKILDDVCEEAGMPAALVDEKNTMMQVSGERNPLCSIIRGKKESLSFICGQTQQFMAEQAKSTREPVIDLCEAGLLKFVVPIFSGSDFKGSVTACGSCVPSEDIETFIITKNTEIDESEISTLAERIAEIDQEEVKNLVRRLFRKLKKDAA